MKRLIPLIAGLLLVGCVSAPHERATASDVQVARTAPVVTGKNGIICNTEYTIADKKQFARPGSVTVIDAADQFIVLNADGSLLMESPHLTERKVNAETGWLNGVMYSRGVGKWKGFYGAFSNGGRALTFDCPSLYKGK